MFKCVQSPTLSSITSVNLSYQVSSKYKRIGSLKREFKDSKSTNNASNIEDTKTVISENESENILFELGSRV